MARDFFLGADRAASMIFLSVEPTIRTAISSLPANEIDDPTRLREFFSQKDDTASTKSSRNDIINQFHNSTVKLGVWVTQYISSRRAIRQEMAGTEEAIEDTTVVSHLLEPYPNRSQYQRRFSKPNLRRSKPWIPFEVA